MNNLVWIVLVALFIFLFWQQRRQSENAKIYIERRCKQLDLQIISIARGKHKFEWLTKPLSITTRYHFEFSSNGLNCFQGYALMKGNRLQELYMPPYPI